jgi:hypothetical protein
MNYDRRAGSAAPGWVFEGTADRKKPAPKDALDDLVKAIRPHIAEFLARVDVQLRALHEMNPDDPGFSNEEMQRMIARYLKSKYGLTDKLIQGIADQIVRGDNY